MNLDVRPPLWAGLNFSLNYEHDLTIERFGSDEHFPPIIPALNEDGADVNAPLNGLSDYGGDPCGGNFDE